MGPDTSHFATGIWGSPPPLELAAFRRQNSILILLSLGVLLCLLGIHLVFRPLLGPLPFAIMAALCIRFLLLLGELWLMGREWLRPATFARISVAVHLLFAVILARMNSGQESHYVVLLVIPVLASAFWLSLAGLGATVLVASGLTIFQVWTPAGSAPAGALVEYFEATTVALIFLLFAIIVRLLVIQQWHQEAEVRAGMAELARTRDRLVQEEKLAAVGRLSGAIAHEIRNPVAMIRTALTATSRPDATPENRDEFFTILAQESLRLERLTEDFLAYARQRRPERRAVEIATALGSAAGLARARAEEAGLQLEVVPSGDWVARLDPFQVQQALLNLLINAIDATPRGRRIRMGARQEGGCAVFFVENEGDAIPPSVAARLGEPFFTTKPRGTGLGLAIARSMARGHGGDLILEENRAGCVRFGFRIPEEEAPWAPS
jgi:signal transduction histidine kinase